MHVHALTAIQGATGHNAAWYVTLCLAPWLSLIFFNLALCFSLGWEGPFAARWGEINIPIVVSVSSTWEKDGFLWMRRVVLGYCPDGLSLVWKPAGRVHRRVRRTSLYKSPR